MSLDFPTWESRLVSKYLQVVQGDRLAAVHTRLLGADAVADLGKGSPDCSWNEIATHLSRRLGRLNTRVAFLRQPDKHIL